MNEKLQAAARKWLTDRNYDLFVTLAFNPTRRPSYRNSDAASLLSGGTARARAHLRSWDAHTNRRLLGPKWQRLYDERIMGVALLEHPDTNVHWHLLLRNPTRCDTRVFEREARYVWRRITSSGTVDVQNIFESKPIVDYVTKEIQKPKCWENFDILGSLQ